MDEDSLDSCLIEVLAEECSKEGVVQPLDANLLKRMQRIKVEAEQAEARAKKKKSEDTLKRRSH
ncbi:hypothetical protein [Vibrio cholerae]|uniref:hypothetical protein n=1 Tax=Vibrio cholerae TaxID=666 RepID=UPI000E6502CD|nr:hypothetical protein [Vibrio cholerae]